MTALVDWAQQQAAVISDSWSYANKVRLAVVSIVLSTVYLRVVVKRVAPSAWSLLLLLPLALLGCWVPSIFSPQTELISRTLFIFLMGWHGLWKAAGMCIGRGPLMSEDWTFAQFLFLYIFPVYPSKRHQAAGAAKAGRLQDAAGARQLVLQALANTVVLCVGAYTLVNVDMNHHVRHWLYALSLHSFVSFVMEGPGALLVTLLGISLVPPFDKPWLSKSIGEFWAQRWNNPTCLLLRVLIYDPVIEGRIFKAAPTPEATGAAPPAAAIADATTAAPKQRARPSMWRRLAGMSAAFAASGLIHEFIMFFIMDEDYIVGHWFMFFFIQAPIVAVEAVLLRRLANANIKVPALVGMVVTQSVLLFTADLFFFPPLEDNGSTLAQRVAQAVTDSFVGLAAQLRVTR